MAEGAPFLQKLPSLCLNEFFRKFFRLAGWIAADQSSSVVIHGPSPRMWVKAPFLDSA
jgi:hypothetical protein